MKKRWLIPPLLALAIAVAFWCAAHSSLSVTTGRFLRADSGACMLISGSTPISLSARSQNGLRLDQLTTGDRILVLHGAVAESYPAQTQVYGVIKTGSGTIEDIPVSVLDSLMDLGWNFPGIERVEQPLPTNPFPTGVSWGNYSDDSLLWQRALNREKVAISSTQHLPILRFDSVSDLNTFKSDIGGVLETQSGYDEVPSFDAVTAHMDDAFFAEHSLLLTYVWAGSCSWRYDVNRVDVERDSLTVHVQRTDSAEIGDCAMAGWFITLTVPKETLEGIRIFDADLGNLME